MRTTGRLKFIKQIDPTGSNLVREAKLQFKRLEMMKKEEILRE